MPQPLPSVTGLPMLSSGTVQSALLNLIEHLALLDVNERELMLAGLDREWLAQTELGLLRLKAMGE